MLSSTLLRFSAPSILSELFLGRICSPCSSSKRERRHRPLMTRIWDTHLENKDCLVRLYVRENSPEGIVYDSSDVLRNFPPYLDQARMLGLEVDQLCMEMAIGHLLLYWGAKVDGQDIELDIGTSTSDIHATDIPDFRSVVPQRILEFKSRSAHLWMVDFDKFSLLDDTSNPADIVNKLFVAVTGNDPCFPNPQLDLQLLTIFQMSYLKTSYAILGSPENKLPGALIEKWGKWVKMNAAYEFDPFKRDAEGSYSEDEDDDDDDDDDDDENEDEDEDEDGDEDDEGSDEESDK